MVYRIPSHPIINTLFALFKMYEDLFLDLLKSGGLILVIPLSYSGLNKVIAII